MFRRMCLCEQQLLLMGGEKRRWKKKRKKERKKAPKYYDYDLSLVMKVTSTQILNLTLISNIQIQHARYLVNLLVRGEILNGSHVDTPTQIFLDSVMNTQRYCKDDHSFDMQGAIWLLPLFFCEHVTSVIFLCPFQNVILSGVFQEVLKKLP